MVTTLEPTLRIGSKSTASPRTLRILFVGEAVSLAHVGRPAILAQWARSVGHDVRFACGPRMQDLAKSEGLDVVPLCTIEGETFYSRLRAGRFFYTRAELEGYLEAERKLIREIRPDLVVGDFRLTLPISCKLEGVPFLNLSHAHWSPSATRLMPAPQTGVFQYLPHAAGAAIFAAARPLAHRLFAKTLDDLRVSHGLKRLNDFRKLYTDGDGCAYLDLPELAPLPGQLPGHFFLGPLVWQPNVSSDAALPDFGSSKPLVYVSFGSSGDTRVLPRVLRGVCDAGCAAAVSGLKQDAVRRLLADDPALAGNCSFSARVQPNELLRRASLTICHGGAGTVYQSLAAGVPVLSIPDNPDQMMIAATIAEHGAGASIRKRDVSAGHVRKEIRRLTTCSQVARRVSLLGMSIRSHDTRGRWLLYLEQFASRFVSKRETSGGSTRLASFATAAPLPIVQRSTAL